MNNKYVEVLSALVKLLRPEDYFVVGSVALLCYTQANGYDRQIKDIDLIIETSSALELVQKLKIQGYQQNTFIDKRMPFYNKLMNHAESRYLRLTKDDVAIEILTTAFERKNDLLIMELYPGIKVGIPCSVHISSEFNNVQFNTVSKEMLYFFKKFSHNTFGRKVKYKEDQRLKDISELHKVIDSEELNAIITSARIYILGLPIKIPGFLIRYER